MRNIKKVRKWPKPESDVLTQNLVFSSRISLQLSRSNKLVQVSYSISRLFEILCHLLHGSVQIAGNFTDFIDFNSVLGYKIWRIQCGDDFG